MTAGFTLARWFAQPDLVNGPCDDEARDYVLGAVYGATAIATEGDTRIVKTPTGVCILEDDEVQGSPLVVFDYVEDKRWVRTRFWMNRSSVADLIERLDELPRGDFNSLFIQGRAGEAS